jgi:penicillin-binding protein 1B
VAVTLSGAAALTRSYTSYSRIIDARLHGERERTLPRVYARPVELRLGQSLSLPDLIARLNDLGYAERALAETPGEFAVAGRVVAILPRNGDLAGRRVRVTFPSLPSSRPAASPRRLQALEVAGRGHVNTVRLDSPLLAALMTSEGREKRRRVPLATIPKYLQQAVLAIEDQAFYSHPGINTIRVLAALFTNVFGNNSNVVGYSTITQQLARMFFLANEFNTELRNGERGRTWGSYARKVREGMMSLVLERRAAKDGILEL